MGRRGPYDAASQLQMFVNILLLVVRLRASPVPA